MSVGIGFTNISANSSTVFDIFGGLNGTGGLVREDSFPFPIAGLGTGSDDPRTLDGVFSFVVKELTGSVDIVAPPSANELNVIDSNGDATAVATVIGTPGTLVVDEPPALALVLAGLIGFGLLTMRRRAQRDPRAA